MSTLGNSHEDAVVRSLCFATNLVSYLVTEHGVSRIIIEANDTDIIVMAIYNKTKINGLKELRIHNNIK